MKIIVPMAGRGTRLRPHTLTTPKPLIKVAGKPIVQRLVEDLAKMSNDTLEEVAFIIGDFGAEVEAELISIAENLGAKATIYYQKTPMGTGHAILCAAPSLDGNVIVAFADTLFQADFTIDNNKDAVIYTQSVEDPSKFGVVKTNKEGTITEFIEKPKEFVSDQAIIGIYYFKDGAGLRNELQYLVDNEILGNGEYQLTDALENMKNKGILFYPGTVSHWLDCGNKDATVDTNKRYMEFIKDDHLIAESAIIKNSVIISPVYIGENAQITDSVVGPHTSIGENTMINSSIIKESLIQDNTEITGANMHNSMIGNKVIYQARAKDLSLGDYNVVKE